MAVNRSAGTASITIRPDATDFTRELERKLKAVKDPGFAITVGADFAQATADVQRWKQQQQRSGVQLGVDVDLKKAQSSVESFRTREAGKTVDVDVESKTAKAEAELARFRKAQELQAIRVQIEFDEASVGGKLKLLQKQFDGVGAKFASGLKINAGALALGSFPAMATALTDVAGAMQQVAQAGLVLPGVIAGIGASVGTAAIGFQGLGDAIKAVGEASDGTPESLAKAEAALTKLSPAAREVATTIGKDLLPEFQRVQREVVSQNMFEGVASSLTDLTAKALPIFERGLGGIATAWNGTFKELARVGGSDETLSIVDRIFGNTADAQTRANAAIEPLVRGLGTLTAAGTDALPRIADGLTAVSERFAAFITKADEDGRLETWINDGLDGITSLGNTFLNLGKTFTGITEAAGGGQGLLGTIESLTGRLATFVNSTEGQSKLREFFEEGREQLAQWGPILGNVADVFGDIYSASKQWTDAILPPLAEITGFLADHEILVQGAASAYVAFKTVDGITSLATSLAGISSTLSGGLPDAANKGAGGISRALASVAVPAWLTYLVYNQGKSIYDNATANDAKFPGQTTPTDPTGSKGMQNRTTGGTVMGVPSYANDKAFQSGPPDIPGGGGPNAQRQRKGLDPIDPTGGLLWPPGGYLNGGPTPSGRGNGPTGGWISELHDDEWVLPKRARAMLGDSFLSSITSGRSFEGGGYVDQYGNPVTPGPGVGPIAPNPAAQPGGGGGLNSIIDNVVSGIQTPLGNALSLAQSLPSAGGTGGVDPATTVHGLGAGMAPGPAETPGGSLSLGDRAAGIPGLFGLFGSMTSSNPAENLMNWGTNTASWLGDFATGFLGSLGSTLWQGALGFFGLENSILSPSNSWNQAISQTGQFAVGQDGPLGALFSSGQSGPGSTSSTADALNPKKIREAQDKIADADGRVAETLARVNELAADAKGSTRLSATNAHAKAVREAEQARTDLSSLYSSTGASGSAAGITPGSLAALPSRGGEGGLQINTINTKRAIEANFPQITEPIGGYRKDPLKWHPNGLALDVMIPGGDTAGGANPAGKALGDRIYQWAAAHSAELGIDMNATLWQKPEHYNHLHIATTGGGYPSMDAGGPTPAGRGPVDGKGGHLAVVHPKEFMISARGRATVPDEFLHALNQGLVDPKALELAGFYPGGPVNVRQGVVLPPPRPNFDPGAGARTRAPQPSPARPAPTPAQPPAPAAPTQAPPPAQSTPPVAQQPPAAAIAAPAAIAPAAPGGTDHNLPAVSTAIRSGAAAIGNAAATAASIGMGGMGGGGGAGAMIQGGIMQAGKVIEDVANVVSSAMVGSVPGSFGDPNLGAYGRVNRPEQNRPVTAEYRGASGGNTYNISGHDTRSVLQMANNEEALQRQARLASIPH